MPSSSDDPLDLGVLLAAVEAAPPVAAVDVVAGRLVDAVGARSVGFLIADFSGRALVRLTAPDQGADRHRQAGTAERVAFEGTPYGDTLRRQEVAVVAEGAGAWVLAPVTTRGEAIGVLECRLSTPPGPGTLADIAVAAHALAYVVIAHRRHTDFFEWGQRTVPLSLAAEIQHQLLPKSFTCEAGQFTLAGWLEPAGDVGGDTFDFSQERDTLHLSMSDAMGHSVHASVLATLLVGALRNGRRRGLDLREQVEEASAALCEHASDGSFVTGQVVRVDLRSQTAAIVNAGHPLPFRVRDGGVESVQLAADPPFGTPFGPGYRVQELELLPGDRLVFVTDGILEREAGQADLPSLLVSLRDEHPRETVQHLCQAVLDRVGGELSDDATVMCLDWHGGPPRQRDASAGADR